MIAVAKMKTTHSIWGRGVSFKFCAMGAQVTASWSVSTKDWCKSLVTHNRQEMLAGGQVGDRGAVSSPRGALLCAADGGSGRAVMRRSDEAQWQGCLCLSAQPILNKQKCFATLSEPLSWDTQGDCLRMPDKRDLNYENSRRNFRFW